MGELLFCGFDDTDKGLCQPQPQQAAGFDDIGKSGFDDLGEGLLVILGGVVCELNPEAIELKVQVRDRFYIIALPHLQDVFVCCQDNHLSLVKVITGMS